MQAKEEVIFTIIVVVIVLIFLGIMFLVILARNNAKRNRLMFENERIKKEFEKTLLNTRLEIQEQTLSRVSREIHDNIGQTLSLVRLQINTLGDRPEEEDVSYTDELLGKAITDLRTLSHSLNTNHIKEKGFEESLRQLLGQLEKTGKFTTDFNVSQDEFRIDDEKGMILFRIIQEVLNNIVKHAEAQHIKVYLSQSEEGSEIGVEDDGCGFDVASIKGGESGIGLRNIKERAKVIGGNLEILSKPGEGTIVKIVF